jgi:hypothetical protein
MITADLAQLVLMQSEQLDWAEKAALTTAAAQARDDDEFRRIAAPVLLKVGPKGYIHGWIFVGAPGVGALVNHPSHGKGTVTGHDGKHVTVKFERSGASHTFEAREGEGKGKLVERGAHAGGLADRVARDPKQIKGMSRDDLKAVDEELTRRAGALGKPGQVSATHKKVKDELARRGGSSGGKLPAVDQEKEKNYKELSSAAYGYDATDPSEQNGRSRVFTDSAKQKEAIRLHTLARNAAPDAKSQEQHASRIDEYKRHLAQIKQQDEMKARAKEHDEAQADIKQGQADIKDFSGDRAAAYDRLSKAHERMAAYYAKHNPGQPELEQKHLGLADFHREQAQEVRDKAEANRKRITERIPQAEKIVEEREAKARQSGKKADLDSAIGGHEEIARNARSIGMGDVADKHDAAAAALAALAERISGGKATAEPRAEADALSKKAKRSGTEKDHAAAAAAYAKIADDPGTSQSDRVKARTAGSDHRKALESIDGADEDEQDAKIHADAAERRQDPEAHRAAAGAYISAAEYMDEVPGGKKRATALRAKAKTHEDAAVDIEKKTAEYAQRFTLANRVTNGANRTNNPDDRRSAAAAHRLAARDSLTDAQRRYHEGEAASQERKARLTTAA